MAESRNIIADGTFLQNLIPQKRPFVMVDTLTSYSENQIVSEFTITHNNILVEKEHFSESGLIENMAQTVALHTGYKYYLKKMPAPVGYIGAIKKAEVLELPEINQKLITEVEILHDIMDVTLVQARVKCNGKLIASSEMKTILAS